MEKRPTRPRNAYLFHLEANKAKIVEQASGVYVQACNFALCQNLARVVNRRPGALSGEGQGSEETVRQGREGIYCWRRRNEAVPLWASLGSKVIGLK